MPRRAEGGRRQARPTRGGAAPASTEPGPPPALAELRALRTAAGRNRSPPYREAVEAAIARAAEAGEGGVAYRAPRRAAASSTPTRFEAAKERRAGIDFEDLQILAARLLERAEIGEAYRSRFRHLLVDEFQDTNRLQLRLIEALHGPAVAAGRRRRRAAVDLRLPPRRPRRLPRAAASRSSGDAGAELMRAQRQLPLAPRGDRRRQPASARRCSAPPTGRCGSARRPATRGAARLRPARSSCC